MTFGLVCETSEPVRSPRLLLEAESMSGMFFSQANLEPMRAGYTEIPGFINHLVRDQKTTYRLKNKALVLLDQGHKVLIAYESQAYGGGEGYVALMVNLFFSSPLNR